MSQEIEIEFKQLLDEDTYNKMAAYYQSSPPFRQVNHYFETEARLLKTYGAALRVREKSGKFMLTLKEPYQEGLLETHQEIGESAFQALKNKGLLPQGETTDQLIQLCGQMPALEYLGSLETERIEVQLSAGLLVLDRSDYVGRTDFELEFECSESASGRDFFHSLLEEWSLTWNEPENKIVRFYRAAFE